MEMLTGGVMLVMLGVLAGEAPRLHWGAISSQSLIAFAYLVVFGSIVGFSAYIYLLEKTRPALATSYAFVNPLVAVFLGWALASEQITARIVVATPLIVGAVVLISVDRARPRNKCSLKRWRLRGARTIKFGLNRIGSSSAPTASESCNCSSPVF